jgi:hypothetical protein
MLYYVRKYLYTNIRWKTANTAQSLHERIFMAKQSLYSTFLYNKIILEEIRENACVHWSRPKHKFATICFE